MTLCPLTATGCTFIGNLAGRGAGIINTNSSNLKVNNCTFSGNWINNASGGGMFNGDDVSDVKVTNCTFSGNSASGTYSEGGGLYNYNGNLTITDWIFRGNTAPRGAQIFNDGGHGILVVNCSNVQDGRTGDGNINEDLLFIDPIWTDGIAGTGDEDLHLKSY